MALVHLYFNV